MKRFVLLLSAAAVAALSLAAPVSAQIDDPDLLAEVVAFRAEVRANHRDFGLLRRCGAERDPAEVQRVSDTAIAIAEHADALATRLSGKDHVQMLGIRDVAEVDSWLVWTVPEICYQAPAD